MRLNRHIMRTRGVSRVGTREFGAGRGGTPVIRMVGTARFRIRFSLSPHICGHAHGSEVIPL